MADFRVDLNEALEMLERKPQAIETSTCVFCGKPVTEFRDDLSRKEYGISGLCQECQDETFGEDD